MKRTERPRLALSRAIVRALGEPALAPVRGAQRPPTDPPTMSTCSCVTCAGGCG